MTGLLSEMERIIQNGRSEVSKDASIRDNLGNAMYQLYDARIAMALFQDNTQLAHQIYEEFEGMEPPPIWQYKLFFKRDIVYYYVEKERFREAREFIEKITDPDERVELMLQFSDFCYSRKVTLNAVMECQDNAEEEMEEEEPEVRTPILKIV
jgi:hypothetical protein